MLNKVQLKKLINRAGKEGRLLWAYKDGIHYISDGYFVLKANEQVFDSELVGLMYKYFGMKPKSEDIAYKNQVEMKPDKVTGKQKPVYKAIEADVKIDFFIDGTAIKDEYTLVEFLKTYVGWGNGEIALYGEFDKDVMTVIAVNRDFHELLAWNKTDVTVPCTQYYKGKFGGIMFHDINTDTVIWILSMRGKRPKTLADRYVMEYEAVTNGEDAQ